MSKNFYVISLVILLLEALLVWGVFKTPVSGFSQNILKTSFFITLALSPIYMYALIYRVLKKTKAKIIVFKIVWFLIYILSIALFAIISDYVLLFFGYDIHKIAANIIAVIVVIIYMVLQGIYVEDRV